MATPRTAQDPSRVWCPIRVFSTRGVSANHTNVDMNEFDVRFLFGVHSGLSVFIRQLETGFLPNSPSQGSDSGHGAMKSKSRHRCVPDSKRLESTIRYRPKTSRSLLFPTQNCETLRAKERTVVSENFSLINGAVFDEDFKGTSIGCDPKDHMPILTCDFRDPAKSYNAFWLHRR